MEKEDILAYHLPRYNELPDLGLFMEQLLIYLEDHLLLLEEDKKITKTMINNYVKQGLVNKPEKKRYSRDHIAYLIVVLILKRVYTLDEIVLMIKVQVKASNVERAYNIFAAEYENCLRAVVTGTEFNDLDVNASEEVKTLLMNTIKSIAYQFWNKICLEKTKQIRIAQKQLSE